MSHIDHTPSRLQQGSTLLVAVVILLLASLMALMAMNVGVFEQRTSGNDLRAKVVHQVAEAGLAQGFEYLMRANPQMLDDPANWEKCGSETTFPCGAVDPAISGDMWRLKAGVGGYTDAKPNPLDGELTKFMLPNSAVVPAAGSLDVAYGVAPVLCRVPVQTPPVTNIACSTASNIGSLSDRRVVTFVSVAQVRGDAGRTTLTQTVARSSLLAQPGGVPAVVATGSVTPNGGGDIVAMPDAAGEGLDLAIWTRLDAQTNAGAFGACDRQTWLNSCGIQLSNTDWMTDGAVTNQCSCNKTAGPEGWDILDVDGSGLNKDVKPKEFPCDLFEFAFGVKAWTNSTPSDLDNFCETRVPKTEYSINGKKASLYPDEAFLYTNASIIIGGDAALVRADQKLPVGGKLDKNSQGLIWCLTDCLKDYNSQATIGSPEKPVAMVVDGQVTHHATIFGLVFVRDNTAGPLVASTGGSAGFKFNAQSAVFGSVLIQGVVPKGSGGGLIYGDANILTTLASQQGMARFDTLRGGWSDRRSF